MHINRKNLRLKGWSEEDIEQAIEILEEAEKKKHPATFILDKMMFIVALLLIFVGLYTFATREKGCFIEHHILLKEEIKESPECKVDECLFITTQPIDKENDYTRELHFGYDTKTLNEKRGFETGDTLIFRWCKNKELERYFITGMEKVEE